MSSKAHFTFALWESAKIAYEKGGTASVVPWFLILFVFLPLPTLVYFFPKVLPSLDLAYVPLLLTGCASGTGMLGAMTVNLMSQVTALVNDKHFSDFLTATKTFTVTIFVPQYTFMTVFFSLFSSILTFFVYALPETKWATPHLTIVTMGLVLYAALNVWSLIDLARRLAWHRKDYATKLEQEIERLKDELKDRKD